MNSEEVSFGRILGWTGNLLLDEVWANDSSDLSVVCLVIADVVLDVVAS